MRKTQLQQNIENILNEVGKKDNVIIKDFLIGREKPIDAAIIYVKSIVDQNIIDRDILSPLMLQIDDSFSKNPNPVEFICKKYIIASNTTLEEDVKKVSDAVNSGSTIVLIGNYKSFIVVDTSKNVGRSVSEPPNEAAIKGTREGFIESLDTNVALIRRYIKDKKLTIEYMQVGRRTQTKLALIYIDDIADTKVVDEVRQRISAVDVDSVFDNGILMQYIEDYPLSPFTQIYGTQRPDTVTANIFEGRVAIVLDRSPYVITVPATFFEFFQSVEDYNERTLNASFTRILRMLTIPIVITLPALYLSLLIYNVELIPVKLVSPIIESRQGIYLSPFLEILSMELIVEFLREGGLRLPVKVAQTLSIVGGIIIGNTAVQSRVVSPTTLLVIGISTVSTFLIQNYEMSLSIRVLRFPMLVLANALGFLGIAAGWFFLIVHLMSMESFGVEYFKISLSDLKDTLIRAPLWTMKKRPDSVPVKNKKRMTDFRKKIRGNKDEQ